VAGRLAEKRGLARLARHATERSRAGRGPDEGVRIVGETLHPRLVAEDAASAHPAGRIDRQDRDLVAQAGEVGAKGIDEGALARARNPADADPLRLSRMRQYTRQHLL